MKALEEASFAALAERVSALYNEEEDALLLGVLAQDYVIRRDGISLHGQKAPEGHKAVILDYLFSSGRELSTSPWRAIGDFAGGPVHEFRKKVEAPIAQYVADVVRRAGAVLPTVSGSLTSTVTRGS